MITQEWILLIIGVVLGTIIANVYRYFFTKRLTASGNIKSNVTVDIIKHTADVSVQGPLNDVLDHLETVIDAFRAPPAEKESTEDDSFQTRIYAKANWILANDLTDDAEYSRETEALMHEFLDNGASMGFTDKALTNLIRSMKESQDAAQHGNHK